VILVLRALGIGDLATAVPALRALRAARPGAAWPGWGAAWPGWGAAWPGWGAARPGWGAARPGWGAARPVLALAAPGWLAPLVELTGAVDRQLPVDGLDRPVRLPPAQWAVNLHGRGPQSHRLLLAARPGRLLGFASAAAGHLDGPEWLEQEHEVSRWCRLLSWYGIPADPDDLDLLPPPGAAVRAVPAGATVVHVGAKEDTRRWPVDRCAAVARELAAAGHRVVVTGSAAELPRAASVARRAGLPRTAVYAGRTDLARLAALVAGARLVVSGDTGVAHVATAYRVPSVVVFGPQPPARWGPPAGRPWHRAVWREGSDHVAAVGVAEVLAAVAAVASVASGAVRGPDLGRDVKAGGKTAAAAQ
jgi:Glycosyltransferase family 9 (heptosyltransferase)